MKDETKLKALQCAGAALDKRAENVRVLDISHVSGFTDFFVICSGTSDRQVQSIADSVEMSLRSDRRIPLSVEGYSDGRWIVIDGGDVVIHVFLDAIRDYYDLESLWSDARPVSIPPELYGAPAAASQARP
jgi:ribosome-associated protein